MTTHWTDPLVILTAIYVAASIALWLTTKKAANAAMKSAEAASTSATAASASAAASTRSAELLAVLNRPYMGVGQVGFDSAPRSAVLWRISWSIKNFGTMPALKVEARIEFVIGATVLFAQAGPRSAEIFPQSEISQTLANFDFSGPNRIAVHNGAVEIVARIHIDYSAPNGQRYNHRADALFHRFTETFVVVDSATTAA